MKWFQIAVAFLVLTLSLCSCSTSVPAVPVVEASVAKTESSVIPNISVPNNSPQIIPDNGYGYSEEINDMVWLAAAIGVINHEPVANEPPISVAAKGPKINGPGTLVVKDVKIKNPNKGYWVIGDFTGGRYNNIGMLVYLRYEK